MTERIKAAKDHVCIHCGQPILKGHMYHLSELRSYTQNQRVRIHDECVGAWRTAGCSRTQASNTRPVIDYGRTVVVRRSPALAHRITYRGPGPSTVFVCRLEGELTVSTAHTRALEQALKYDLADWDSNPGNLFAIKPKLEHYTVVTDFVGFPSIIRPE